jgi:hypothetical protein
MATPKIYKRIQVKIASYFWLFNIATVILFSLAALCILLGPKEADSVPVRFLAAIIFGTFSVIFMVLGMVSSYQQESRIRAIPVIGRLHKALMSKQTEWAEALHINFMVLMCVFFIVFLFLAMEKF